MRVFGKTHIDFMGKRNLWYVVSGTTILAGLVSVIIKGFDFGIDFLGGTELIVTFSQPVQIGDVRNAMDMSGFTRVEIKSFGSDKDILIRTPEQEEGSVIGDRIRAGLSQRFPNTPFTVIKEDKVGPKVGSELRRDAVYAVMAAVIAICLYVAFRFKFIYGVGAMVSLFHDVLVTFGLVSIFDGITPQFNFEISQNMVAAFLTLLGLSMNDTVVIFDRIRENQKIFRNMGLIDLINKSLNETLSRTIITSGTIFIVLIVLLFFGGEVNRGLAFTLTVGIVTGTYSSIYIASAIVVEWTTRRQKTAKLID